MKQLIKYIFLLFFFQSFAQDAIQHKVYLVGDAGEDTIPGKALLMLKEELLKNPNSSVVFLGDNVYPSGLKKNNKESVLHLESQLQILKDYKGSVFFIPGNHDWQAQKRNGLSILKDQEVYVEDYLKKNSTVSNKENTTFLPKNGLPGPETVMLADHLRLIIIDTQWFLHFYKKNTIGSKKNTKKIFYKRLDSLLVFAKANNEQVIIAGHHPIFSNGQHGRPKQPLRFSINCTPLQLFGLLGLNRLYSQDLSGPRYRRMRKKMLSSFNKYDNIVYASGHEHNLQCFKNKGNRFIVSGSGSKRSKLMYRKRFDSVFQDDKTTGFIKLEYSEEKYKSTTIYRVGEKEKALEGY
ncbi:MAG TPA: metallophosphoesterase [Bacteroidia bacterium]|nr:metallophosphoesterase [Bacteroidia bacterium]